MLAEQDSRCAYTGLDLKVFRMRAGRYRDCTASLDRIDSSRGYEPGNIQWVHKSVNIMKGTLRHSEFVRFCKLVARWERAKFSQARMGGKPKEQRGACDDHTPLLFRDME